MSNPTDLKPNNGYDMKKWMKRRMTLLFLLWSFSCSISAQPFIQEIRAFQSQDAVQKPLPGSILFIGSSSFTKWKDVGDYFPGHRILNRGFGGSSLTHLIQYADQVIFPYDPAQVVVYCGENDVAASATVTADTVLNRFRELHGLIRSRYPRVPILFVSLKPSPSRLEFLPTMFKTNNLIRQFCQKKRYTVFVDIYKNMLDREGNPRDELFLSDRLHMNTLGYVIWQKQLAPRLIKNVKN